MAAEIKGPGGLERLEWKEFWWKNVTGPQTVISQMIHLLINRGAVVLKVPSDLPWRREMRTVFEASFRQSSNLPNALVQVIDASSEYREYERASCGEKCPKGTDKKDFEDRKTGRYILNRFATDPSVRSGYRPWAGKKIQDYISENKVLQDTVLWIQGLSREQAARWTGFCGRYSGGGPGNGLFILETRDTLPLTFKTVDFDQYVNGYDLQLFNSFVLGSSHDTNWKKYIATAAALLCGTDAEVSEQLIRTTDFTQEEPVEAVIRLSKQPGFERRGTEAGHVFSYCRSGNVRELEKRIWTAQVQVLFPIIELERMEIIDSLSGGIRAALDDMAFEGEPMKQYEKEIQTPQDLDIGGLYYMLHHRKADQSAYVLYLPDEALRERVRFLRDCRNHLAHASCCPVADIRQLLEGAVTQ